jgi:glucokinase
MMIAGFDIGGTHARLRVFDEDFEVVHEERRRIRGETEPDQVAVAITEMLMKAPDLERVGIGIAGLLSKDGRFVFNSPNLHWRDVDFASRLEARAPNHRFTIVNDLNAMLWGEYRAGAVKDTRDVLAVYVGTGIGGAILSDGNLILGGGGKAGEIGHTKVTIGGRACGCGGNGCVEAYAGGVHLEAMVAHAHPDRFGDEPDLGKADAMFGDDDGVTDIWERATDYLAFVVANACTLLNPSVLLLGGGVVENLDNYRQLLLRKVSPLIVEPARQDLDVRFGELDEAAVLGAALLAAR